MKTRGSEASARRAFGLSVVRCLLCLTLGGQGACAQLQPRPELPPEFAIAPGQDTPFDRATAELEAQRPGQSAFRLVTEGTEAFVIRAQSARMAVRSLDVQTYIWHADLTGMFLVQALIEAADRQVKVRVLLDDMDARAKNAGFAALAAHPNIQVRMFNPFASRSGKLRLASEALRNFDRINHRMHNKTWIADNRLAVAGGRNIGDEYFGASEEVNFVDLDFAMVGPVVRDASASFDAYWNSPSAYPIEMLDGQNVSAESLDRLRKVLAANNRAAEAGKYGDALRADDSVRCLTQGDWPMQWTSTYRFVADDPLKMTMTARDEKRAQVGVALASAVRAAHEQLTIVSPYFVPGDDVTDSLAGMARSGKTVRVLTNSLVANDVAAVHGGYSRYRKPLLQGGVQLWELKPRSVGETNSSLFGSSGASLHTKALTVDSNVLFVGSYNLDPRSTWLNCEQGVLVENAILAAQLQEIFTAQTSGQHAWRVSLSDGEMHWSDGTETFDSDPKASLTKRFQAWLIRVLRLEAQL